MDFKILIKKLNGKLTKKEAIIFNQWYHESAVHRSYFNRLKDNYSQELDNIDVEKAWQKLSQKISKRKKSQAYWKFGVAASIALLVALTIMFNRDSLQNSEPTVVHSDISVGTDKATLTLEDGSVVVLEKGKKYQTQNASSNGEEIIYNKTTNTRKSLTYNYITVPIGGQYNVVLSDGTQVWLNSDSQLKYPVSFVEGETRQVELVYGEAYFDVSSSFEHAGSGFRVNNKSQIIEVLGTEFNVKAYKDEEHIYTTLVEGEVLFIAGAVEEKLAPSQQMVLNISNGNMLVMEVNVYNEISWKDGIFSFRRKPLGEIMRVLSRWYDIEVIFENKKLENAGFNGVLGRDQNIEEIIEAIKNFGIIENYEINNKTVILK
ncbi:FecR family protein [Gelidibacter japonicus]|uniref:FecR family protein n=1 Tax=Gelidibacter japonicus TaxID=1962232 RepID=UPI002AFDFD16|nr:FecR domain-containing protein [Gelidibacter japonicus]